MALRRNVWYGAGGKQSGGGRMRHGRATLSEDVGGGGVAALNINGTWRWIVA